MQNSPRQTGHKTLPGCPKCGTSKDGSRSFFPPSDAVVSLKTPHVIPLGVWWYWCPWRQGITTSAWEEVQLPVCHDIIALAEVILFSAASFCQKKGALSINQPKLLTPTSYPKVSYTYKYTYIDIYEKLPNSDLKYLFLFFFCFVAMLSCIHVS